MEELSRKERRELKREAREVSVARERRNFQLKKLYKWFLVLVILAGVVFGLVYFLNLRKPASPDLSQAVPVLERSHVPVGASVPGYNSNPPTSGPHWPDPTSRGTHNEELSDEILVHDLEHGEVWISYHPRIPEDIKTELQAIAKSFSKVVLTPRSKNDTDVALAAWGRLDKFNLEGKSLEKTRVENFIKRYRNKGPELVP